MTGTYEHTIDSKGRLFLPARLKDKMGESFHLAMSKDRSLTIYPDEAWDRLCERGEQLKDPDLRKTFEAFLGCAFPCTLDSQNRIVVPAKLREHAMLEKDVVVIGANKVARIWDAARWKQRSEEYLQPDRIDRLDSEIFL